METNDLLFKLYDKKAIVDIEQQAMTAFNMSTADLMQKAVKACVDLVLEEFATAQRIIVFCGVGQNATDGLNIAGQLKALGKNIQIVKAVDWKEDFIIDADLIIDALFGIGINRDLIGVWQQIIEKINNSTIPVLSVDMPSGVDPDSGKIWNIAVKATTTMTFVGLKQGLFSGIAKNYSGVVKFNNLGIPIEAYNNISCQTLRLAKKDFKDFLTVRDPASHKGHFGKLLIMGGQDGMLGAPLLAGKAALRTGAGLVYVVANNDTQQLPINACLEIQMQSFAGSKHLKELINKATVILLGPGMGLKHNAAAFFEQAMETKLPLIVDGDGLNMLADLANNKNFKMRENWILTPHPKEAARLLKTDVEVIENDRFAAILQLANKFKATVVLKGSGTLIKEYTPNNDSMVYLCDLGNPGMATAGMGDILSGIITALVAQNLSLKDACNLGVFIHGLAGDVVAKEGQRGMVASDILGFIRKIVNTIC